MKVIKPGWWNLPWTKRIECERCEAVLELEEADLTFSGVHKAAVARCAECKRHIYLYETHLNPRLAEKLKTAIDNARCSGGSWRD